MTLKEFAASRGVEYNTLMQWLYRRPDLRGKMRKEGKSYIIDPGDGIYEVLDKQYPPPKPIQIVQDDEARQALAEAQKKIELLQDRLLQASEQLRELEGTRLLLEHRNREYEQLELREAQATEAAEEAEAAKKKAEVEADDARARAEQREKEAREAMEEADRLRAKAAEAERVAEEAKSRVDQMEKAGLFARIFRSW